MNNSQATTIDLETVESVYKNILAAEAILKDLRGKLIKLVPQRYGSELWWEKSDQRAIESIRAGRGKKFNTYEKAVKYLTS